MRFTIDDWLGPTDAIVQCRQCGGYGLIRLVHWQGPNLVTRIYAMSEIGESPARTFMKDMTTGYCDLARHGQEVDALLATTGRVTHLIVTSVPDMIVQRVHDAAAMPDLQVLSWRKQAPEPTESRWQPLL